MDTIDIVTKVIVPIVSIIVTTGIGLVINYQKRIMRMLKKIDMKVSANHYACTVVLDGDYTTPYDEEMSRQQNEYKTFKD